MSFQRNLVLVHSPGFQARADFETVAEKARKLDETTRVLIAHNHDDNRDLNKQIEELPTLVFSPVRLNKFVPVRGIVFQGGAIDKLTQQRRFNEHGIRTPKTALLTRNRILSEKEWGSHVVLKPLAVEKQSSGQSVYLIGTQRLNRDIHIAGLFDRYDMAGGVIVQNFVNCGPELEYHRVLALFGETLYVLRTRLRKPVSLDAAAHVNGTIPIANLGYSHDEKIVDFVSDAAFFEIARSCYTAFPERSLQAIDVLQSRDDKMFYVIEANLGGNTWHFSSDYLAKKVNSEELRQMTTGKLMQFGAFDVAARALIRNTRLLATDGHA